MPYIFVEELTDEQEAADVVSREEYEAIIQERDNAVSEKETLQTNLDETIVDRDRLSEELNSAKTKFANAFLSSPQHAKDVQKSEMAEEETPKTFRTLFEERNSYHAN